MEIDYGVYQELVDEKKQQLFRSVKQRLTGKQFQVVKLAFEVANHAHSKQKRKSGEPYITHPTEVALIIAEWKLDEQTIAGALLHDVIEDTEITKADIIQIFGQHIAELVDGVTKLEKLHFESEEVAHAEYFRKVALAMAKDIRVILIKLADRLHNMRTLSSMNPSKRRQVALETMEIYAPIANKIGLHQIYLQLTDESFKHLYPIRYKVLSKAIEDAQKKRLPIVEKILHNISSSLKSNGISAKFIYRQRSIYNLYRRMLARGQGFSRIYNDIFEIRIIVFTIRDCYLTLGVLHNLYQPLPSKFKDHIAIPKSNGYQSLHSTLIGPQGIPLQLHIRTEAMEDVAENGIISQWLNQENNDSLFNQKHNNNWINNILDIQASSFSANDFLASIKHDLSPSDIYVFTPKGKIILLPKGSTPIDFAYNVNSKLGNHCLSAKVNQQIVKINSKLNDGDIVEIITSDAVEPDDSWLTQVVSGKAISKIKQYIKEQKYDDDINNGIKLINSGLELITAEKITHSTLKKTYAKYYPKFKESELEHEIGRGNIPVLELVKKIIKYPDDKPLDIIISKCNMPIIQDPFCLPLPGDKILAKITRNCELYLHKFSCKQSKGALDNLTFVNILNDINKKFFCKIQAELYNKPGVFTQFAALISKENINIEEIFQESSLNFALVKVTLGVNNLNQVEELISLLKNADFINKAILL